MTETIPDKEENTGHMGSNMTHMAENIKRMAQRHMTCW